MVNIERSKLNQAMYQKLKKFIMNKRKQELHEKKQDAYFKRLKKEKEERKRQAQLDSENLEQIKADIEESKKKVEELKTRKSELFQRFKHLANEESRLKDKHRSEQAAQLALHGTQFGAAQHPAGQSAVGHLPLSAAAAGHHPATPAHPHHSQLTYNNATAAALNILQQSSVPVRPGSSAVQGGNSSGSAVHQQKMLIGLQQNTGAANALLPTTKRNQLSSGSPLQPVTQPLQVIAGSGAYAAAGSVTTQVPGSAYSLGSKVNTVIAVQPNTNSTAAAQAQNQSTVVGNPGAGQQSGYPNAVSTAGKLTAGYPPQLYVDRSQAGAIQGEIDPANLALLKAYNLQQNQQGLQPNYSHLVQNFGRQQNYLESLKSVSGASASVPVVSVAAVAAAGGAANQVTGGSPAANVAAVASSLSNYGKSHLPPAATSYRGSITTGQSAQQIQLQQQQQQQIQAMQQAVQAVAQQQQAQAQAAAAHQQLLQQQILASLTVQAHQQQQAQAQALANAQQQAAAAAAAAAAAVASQHSPKTQGSQGPGTPFNVLSVPHQLAASAGVQGYPVSTAAPGAYSVYQAGQNAVAYQAAHQPQNWAARFSHNR